MWCGILASLSMPPVPINAAPPRLTPELSAKIKPFAGALLQRVNNGEPLGVVVKDVAARARVSPGTVLKYVAALQQQNVGGVPVSAAAASRTPPQDLSPIPMEGDEPLDQE